MRPLQGELNPSPDAPPVCGTTTSPPAAPRTLTALGGHGLWAQHHGYATPFQGALQQPCRAPEVCRRFNEGRCRLPACRYVHTCKVCNGSHPAIQCSRIRQQDPLPSLRRSSPEPGAAKLKNAFLFHIITLRYVLIEFKTVVIRV